MIDHKSFRRVLIGFIAAIALVSCKSAQIQQQPMDFKGDQEFDKMVQITPTEPSGAATEISAPAVASAPAQSAPQKETVGAGNLKSKKASKALQKKTPEPKSF